MLSFDSVQQTIIQAVSKKAFWAFEVDIDGGQYWSTVTRDYDGNSYSFRIIPESFQGIELNRNRAELGLLSPNTLEFDVTNKDNALSASDYIDASIKVSLIISDYSNERRIRSWEFIVKRVDPHVQSGSQHTV